MNPKNVNAETQLKDLNEAARALGLRIHSANAPSERDFEPAFASFVQQGADALVVGTDSFLTNWHKDCWRWRNAIPFPRCMPTTLLLRPGA